MLDLSVIIVNYNTRDLLIDCICSIYAETHSSRFEIFVVDNGSTDGSVAELRAKFPEVKIAEKKRNLGFPAANNEVLPRVSGRYVLLLNPDTVVLDRALDRMLEFMDMHPEIGIVGPKMYDRHMHPWHYETWSMGPLPYLCRPLLLHWWGDIGDKEVSWVCGACLMIRRVVIDEIGPLDTVMFGEDMDWCYRARRAGWRVYHLAQAKIIHYWGEASAAPELSRWRVFVGRQAKIYYARKHAGLLSAAAFSLVLGMEALVKVPLLTLRSWCVDPDARLRLHGQAAGYRRLLGALLRGRILSELP